MLKQIDFGLLIVVAIFAFALILSEYNLTYLSISNNHFRSERGDKSYNISVNLNSAKVIILDTFKVIEEIDEKALQEKIKEKKGIFLESIRHKLNAKKNFNIKIKDKRTIFVYVNSGFYDELYVSEKDIEPSTFCNLILDINKNVIIENKNDEMELYTLLYVALKGYLVSHLFLFYRHNVMIMNPDGTYSIFYIDYKKYGSPNKFNGVGNRLLLELIIRGNHILALCGMFKIESTLYYRDNPFINTVAMYLEKDKDLKVTECIERNEYQKIQEHVNISDFKKLSDLDDLISSLMKYLDSHILVIPS